jgi:hypothetical protein
VSLFGWLFGGAGPAKPSASTGHEETARRLADAWDARTILDRLDEAANAILKSHGFDSWPILVPAPEQIQLAMGYPNLPVWSMPEGTPAEALYAARLLEVVRQVRGFLYGSGSPNDAVILGVRLGIAAEQAGLADLVPLGKRAVRVTPAKSEPNEHVQESLPSVRTRTGTGDV